MSAAALEVRQLSAGYQGRPVLSDISFTVETGQVVALLGRNGIGKSTLLKSVLGLLAPSRGSVLVNGKPLAHLSRRERAQLLAYVPQSSADPMGHTVLDVVLLGRTAWLGWRPNPSKSDDALAHQALERLGIEDLAGANFAELSGGQRQLVLIARALAQGSPLLVMDEPTANLDLGNETRVLTCIKELAAENLTVLFTTHRPEEAFACASDSLILYPEST